MIKNNYENICRHPIQFKTHNSRYRLMHAFRTEQLVNEGIIMSILDYYLSF